MTISEKSSDPLYMQIINNLKVQIISGILKPKEKLLSIREMAVKLMVNPNTIQRAYRELEQEGYIYSLVGKGNFVTDELNEVIQRNKGKLLSEFKERVKEMLLMGVTKEELVKLIKEE